MKYENSYEMLCIILPSYSEEQRNAIIDKLKESITSREGTLLAFKEQGLKPFAMELKKQKEGYYYLLQFTIPCAALKTVQSELVINESLFRYLIVTLDSVYAITDTPTTIPA